MRPWIPDKQPSLGAAQALAGPLDRVERWKLGVRVRLARQAELAGPEPKVRLGVDLKLVVLAAALGAAGGPFAVARSSVLLLSILLVHESSRAALARALGRSARISISLTGGGTEISGPELRGAAAFGFATIGSLANVAFAIALHWASRRVHHPLAELTLRELSAGHAVWGIAQALPLLPFRAGSDLAAACHPRYAPDTPLRRVGWRLGRCSRSSTCRSPRS